jgi:hypothetical protein
MDEYIQKLIDLHNSISFSDKTQLNKEIPEQLMAIKHINHDSIVLELGGSIGRNSCVINSILHTKTNHVVIEPSTMELSILQQNRDSNNFGFFIENSAISKVPLYQGNNPGCTNWHTFNVPLPNTVPVNTIDYNTLIEKYKLIFNTLVIDNEGNFVAMLKDFPSILDNIKLLIIEHDFNTEDDLCYFKKTMTQSGFSMNDMFLKNERYGPGINWSDGLNTDPVFVSVWKK